jgi:hypothetical protein
VAVNELPLLVLGLFDDAISLAVLQNLHFVVDLEVQAHLFISRTLLEVVGDDVEVVLDQIAKGSGIAQLQEDVVDRPDLDVLDAMTLHVAQHVSPLHFRVDGAIAARSQRELAFAFDDDLAFVGERGNTALREEDDGVLVVPEVVVVLEVADDLLVVHLAGHQVPFNEALRVVHPSTVLGNVAQPLQSVREVPEQSQAALQSEVEHALGVVEPEPRALSAAHDANRNFSE